MERNLFEISTLIASVALLVWSIGDTFAYPQGPSVSLGANPIVTISCSASVGHPDYPNTNNKYVVPQGVDFIVTDIATSHGTQGLVALLSTIIRCLQTTAIQPIWVDVQTHLWSEDRFGT